MAASAEPPRGPAPEVRPRYGRITAAGSAAVITLVTALGGLGVLPTGSASAQPYPPSRASVASPAGTPAADPERTATPTPSAGATPPNSGMWLASSARTSTAPDDTPAPDGTPAPESTSSPDSTGAPDVPADSGTGRRIVFDMADQRVWLVDEVRGREAVARTYPVSGSVTDNLKPGTYAVYSKSLHAVGIEDSGTMEYMVRFTHGAHAAIGFHDIPVSHGTLVQTRAQLGTPRSHGCIRQWRPDARALWRFAPVGTKVVVVA